MKIPSAYIHTTESQSECNVGKYCQPQSMHTNASLMQGQRCKKISSPIVCATDYSPIHWGCPSNTSVSHLVQYDLDACGHTLVHVNLTQSETQFPLSTFSILEDRMTRGYWKQNVPSDMWHPRTLLFKSSNWLCSVVAATAWPLVLGVCADHSRRGIWALMWGEHWPSQSGSLDQANRAHQTLQRYSGLL